MNVQLANLHQRRHTTCGDWAGGAFNQPNLTTIGVIAMPIEFSPVIAAKAHASGGIFSVQSIDLEGLGERASPFALLDTFRVSGRPFGPHPHAGFSAITYVFEDSKGALRSRDSLGNDLVVGPGGIVVLQAARGALHEETPAEIGRELHGAQIYVNLSSKSKLAAPQTLWLEKSQVPEWRNGDGDRVRVLAGSFEGVSSPLAPAEPFTLFDAGLHREISFSLEKDHNALVYVLAGDVAVRAAGRVQEVRGEQALALHGSGGRVTLKAAQPAHLLVLSGAEIREPIFAHGPFIMNDRSQIEAAVARYRSGGMGHLTPHGATGSQDANLAATS